MIALHTDKDGLTSPRIVHQTNWAIIPCKPTHPDTEIYLKTFDGEQVKRGSKSNRVILLCHYVSCL